MIIYNYFDFISTTTNHLTINKNNSKYLETELVKYVIFLLFFLITRSVQVSLCIPRLIPEPTEHLASPINR